MRLIESASSTKNAHRIRQTIAKRIGIHNRATRQACPRYNKFMKASECVKLIIGDKVEDIAYLKGMTGTVTEVLPCNPDNPIEEHGFVTVRLDPEHVGNFPCSPPDEEHYVDHEWWKTLRKLHSSPK